MPNNTSTTEEDRRKTTQAWSGGDSTGFCQECGRVLTPATLCRVNSGTFCTDCAGQASPGGNWQSVYAGAPDTQKQRAGQGRHSTGPRPRLAAWLGLMPGVGAMYNGQYGKGAMHLAVFVALVALADHVSDVLYWLVWGWVFYQAFDAYHTAVARRDRQPLPDPFGFNDVGGRFFGGAPAPYMSSSVAPAQEPATERGARSFPEDLPRASAWNGENPYNAPYVRPAWASPASEPVPPVTQARPAHSAAPHRGKTTAVSMMPTPLEGTRRFPVAALWLIGLGLIFLLGNVLPGWHFSGEWIAILTLGLLAAWSAVHRWTRLHAQATDTLQGGVLLRTFSFSAVLLLSGLLLALDATHVAGIARTWPFILVFWGVLLFVQRALPLPVVESPAAFATTSSGTLNSAAYDLEERSFE